MQPAIGLLHYLQLQLWGAMLLLKHLACCSLCAKVQHPG